MEDGWGHGKWSGMGGAASGNSPERQFEKVSVVRVIGSLHGAGRISVPVYAKD